MRNNSLSVTKRIGLFLAAAFCIALIGSKASAQVPITYYDFENNVTRTTFENAVEQQINSGNSTLTKVGAPTTISGGTGAGIALHNTTGATAGTAASATTWSAVTTDPGTAATTYYQFTINTTGFTGTSLSYDEIAGTTAASFPCTGAIISTNGGGTFSSLIAGTCGTNNTWRTKSIALPAAADNNANVVIRVYGYFSDGTAAGTLALDNVTVFATTATAGTKTLLDEGSLFTSITSGATGSLFIRTNFTVNGASITTFNTGPATLAEVFNGTLAVTSGTFTLAGSISANLAATAVTVSSGATLSCGTAANIISGAGSFTLNSGGNLSISSANGITSGTTAAGNIQVTGGRTYNAAANYTYIRNATGAQVTGNGLPTSLTGNLTSNLGASADNPLTLTQSTTVAGTTTVSTKTFDLGANTLTTNGNTTISSGAAMTVNNGAILKNAGTVTTTGTLTFNNGGKYQHNFTTTGGTIPTATWNTGSTCEIIGYTSNSATPGGLGQSFYNFTWNSPSQTGNISAGGGFTTANGTLTIQTTGTGSFRLAASTSPTVNISGDLVVNGGTFIFSTGAGVPIVNVIGNVTLGGGTLQPATSTGVPVFNVAGNWSNNGGTFTPGTGTVNFNSTTATQTIGGTASTQTFNSITVSKSGQTLNIGGSTTALIISNALNVNAGTFDQGASANLTSGPITVASGATFQSLGTGDLTLSGNVSNSGTITLNANGNTCGQADDILIRSSVNGTQRSWSGAGTFNMTDVDVKDQAGTASILVRNGTNSGNNGANWVFFAGCTGAPYTWNGTTLADWNVGTNWTPTRLAPDPGDILTINGTSTPSPTLTNVPTQTIAALRLINGASATLQTNGANTLTINGATGSDLSVPSGNTLILDGSNALRLSVASGSNGVIGGQVIVQGGAHRVIGNAANAITFQSGALFTTGAGFTGNAFGAGGGDGATGSVIFASGSAYFHNAGSSPFGNSANPAVAVFQTGSLATFLTGSGFEASGRTYADLAIGSVDPGGIAVTASDSGTGNFQFDNLTVNSNTAGNSSLSFTGSGSSTVTIRGNITSVDGTGTLSDVTLSGGTGGIVINKPGGGTLTFGTSGNSKAMTFDSSASVASNTTLTLARKLIVGTITPSSFVLSVDINGALNGSATGYVIGKLLKNFSPSLTANTYQVGTVNGYSPVDVNNASGTGSLTINATQDFQPTISDTTKALQRYWTLSNIGLAQADLVFHYLDGDVPGTATESNFQVFKIDPGPTRTNMGGTINTGANTATVTGVTSFSDWTLAEPASISPTIVRLTGFDAVADGQTVQMRWQSGYEAHNLGYQIYREVNGHRTRITPSIVAGSALLAGTRTILTAGQSYTWYDRLPAGVNSGAVSYYLEDVDTNGTRTIHGPISAATGTIKRNSSAQAQSELLSEMNGERTGNNSNVQGWATQSGWPTTGRVNVSPIITNTDDLRIGRASSPTTLQTQQQIAGMQAVKIQVNRTGWQRVNQSDLYAAGLDQNADQRMLQLYVNGIEVPISINSGVIEFYGVAEDTATSDSQTYYLIVGSAPGKRIPRLVQKGSGETVRPDQTAGSFDYTIERRERTTYFPGLDNGDADSFFGAVITNAGAVTEPLQISHLDTNRAGQTSLSVTLQGVTDGAHQVSIMLNGTDVGTASFNDREHPTRQLSVNNSLLLEGSNSVQLVALGGDSDISLVDSVRLTYGHTYFADSNRLSFVSRGRPTVVDGFTSSSLRVVDITNPANPEEWTPTILRRTDGTYAVSVTAPPGESSASAHTLVIFTNSEAESPASITRNIPSTLSQSSNGADFLIIAHHDLLNAVQPLAQLRESQGMTVSVVDAEDVYDEFSYGAHSPQAIRDFLVLATSSWTLKPRYVLLVGDATYDPRNYIGMGSNDMVPTKLLYADTMKTASDDWFADFDGDNVPDMGVGRLPVRTAGDAALVINKIVTYTPQPSQGALLIADRNDSNNFEGETQSLRAVLPADMQVQVINRGNTDVGTVHSQLLNGLNQGPMVANYYGHGSVGVWTGSGLLNTNDAAALTNGNRLPLLTSMTCLNGFFHDLVDDSMAEAFLKSQQGGAVAVWASSGLTNTAAQAEIDRQFYQILFGNTNVAVGDAIRGAKAATQDQSVRRTWVFFGDPTMRLR